MQFCDHSVSDFYQEASKQRDVQWLVREESGGLTDCFLREILLLFLQPDIFLTELLVFAVIE